MKRLNYAEFMNFFLYDPVEGYYMKEQKKIGANGDFYTSSNVSDIFGIVLADVFIELIKKGMSAEVIELGGGTGRLARAILNRWQEADNDSFQKLTYTIIETSPYHRNLQKEILEPYMSCVKQYESLNGIKKKSAIVFSNEFFDAFPVHVIKKCDNQLYEIYVVEQDNIVSEEYCPLENKEILQFLEEQQMELVNGQRFEIPLAMKNFLQTELLFLEEAMLFTIDYGYTNEEWALPQHKDGSLRGYANHQLINNPLTRPGEIDLTTHVHFDALNFYGSKAGWLWDGLFRQDEFLLNAGILNYLQEHFDPNPFSEVSKKNRAIRSLITDGGMSPYFRVAIQRKGN